MAASIWQYIGTPWTGRVKVRMLIGDTDPDDPILNDYEIDAVLSVYTNEVEAAAWVCLGLSAKYASEGDITHGRYKFENISKSKRYDELSKRYFKQVYGVPYPITSVSPSFGGISQSNKDANDGDTDNVDPYFYRGQFENPEVEYDDDESN